MGSVNELAKTLLLVQIFRHGDRTASTSYPNDPLKNYTFPPYGRGELTLAGKQRAFKLGQLLREDYGDFLGDIYSRMFAESYSSPSGRAQTTLQCVHAGLFPPLTEEQILDPELHWQPVGYHTFSSKDDKYLGTHISLSAELDVKKEIKGERKKFYDYLSEHAGFPVKTSHDVFKIQNSILTQIDFGLEVPKWAQPIWPDVFKKYSQEVWKDLAKYKHSLFIGPLVEMITRNAKEKIDGANTKKIILYSGHDINIYLLLAALGSLHDQTAGYCASVTFELHKINETLGFKVYFRSHLFEKFAVRLPDMKDDDDFIPMDKFVEHTKHLYEKPNIASSTSGLFCGNVCLFIVCSALFASFSQ